MNGPLILWHIDTNHELIRYIGVINCVKALKSSISLEYYTVNNRQLCIYRWGFVIHVGIDGYSRMVVFLN